MIIIIEKVTRRKNVDDDYVSVYMSMRVYVCKSSNERNKRKILRRLLIIMKIYTEKGGKSSYNGN